jgi:type IV secretory pathway VirB10-like protein
MFADSLIIIIVAFGLLAVTYLLFNSVAAVPKTKATKAAPSTQQVAEKKKATKQKNKVAAKAKAAEAEMDALVAKEASSVRGMSKDKAPLQTLEQIRANQAAQAKKVAPVSKSAFSEEEKVTQKAHGFKSISKVAPVAKKAQGGEAKVTKKEALDKKLGQFFKKGKGEKGEKGGKQQEEDVAGNGGTVTMKQAFKTTDPRGLWTGEHEW